VLGSSLVTGTENKIKVCSQPPYWCPHIVEAESVWCDEKEGEELN